jgi:serine/threonine-protein kinase
MEHLRGEDLRSIETQARRRGQKIPPHIAAMIIGQACDGLHYAHSLEDTTGRRMGLVHRDVSPSNLFVTWQGTVKVLDFGIARAGSRVADTQPGVVKGKLSYLSPEQIQGGPLDARSDLFSLGLVLFELLTGERAVQGRGHVGVMKAILEGSLPRARDRRSDLPRELDAIIAKALERDPARRYASAAVLRQALDGFLADYTYRSHSDQLREYLHGLFGAEHVQWQLSGADATQEPTKTSEVSPPKSETLDLRAEASVLAASSAPRVEGRSSRPIQWSLLAVVPLAVIAAALFVKHPSPAQADTGRSSQVHVVEAPSPSPPPAQAPALAPKPAQTQAPTQAQAPAPARARHIRAQEVFGSLQVNCLPWCQIYLDGADTRQVSPSGDIRVAAGRHRLKVVSPTLGRDLERTVTINPGERAREFFRFP